MAFFDWNQNGKDDMFDSFVDYQVYKDTFGEEDEYDYGDDYATVPEDEYRGKLSPEQYRQRYAEWEDKARSFYESLVDVLNTSSGDEVHINKHKANESVLYQSGMRELLIRSQGQMRRVRSEAASYGVTIMQSHWETCSPPSRY